ncbi:MAG: hypothetical protein WCR52_01855 [Bacteroidota bacterium]
MNRPTTLTFSSLLLLCLLGNCTKQDPYFYDGPGKKPVYAPLNTLTDIKNESPQAIQTSGTIFLRDTLLFILEQRKGIHVFSLADTLNTVNLAFFKIPAITDFTVVGNTIYADSWKDLVVIDISNLNQIFEKNRIHDVITPALYPPLYHGAFECVDESKGAVVDWSYDHLNDAKCTTFQ